MLDDGDLVGLEGIGMECEEWNFNFSDSELAGGDFDPEYDGLHESLPISCMMPETALGQVSGGADRLVPSMVMSDCMFQNDNQRLYSVQSTPSLPCSLEPQPAMEYILPPFRPATSVHESCTTTPSQLASFQVISQMNSVENEVISPARKAVSVRHNSKYPPPMPHHLVIDKFPSPPSVHSYPMTYDSSPSNVPTSYLTPSPESDSSSSSSSSSPHASHTEWIAC